MAALAAVVGGCSSGGSALSDVPVTYRFENVRTDAKSDELVAIKGILEEHASKPVEVTTGAAYLLRHPASTSEREDSGGEAQTTNNRMELRAVIEGLTALKSRSRVVLTSDSKYVLDGMKEWLPNWKKRGWKTASKQPVKNQDLWQQLDALLAQHDIDFRWIRGHTGHAENERCDQMAVEAARAYGYR